MLAGLYIADTINEYQNVSPMVTSLVWNLVCCHGNKTVKC